MINNISVIAFSVILIFYILGLISTIVLLKSRSSREFYRKSMMERVESDKNIISYLKSLSTRIFFGIIIIVILLLFNLK